MSDKTKFVGTVRKCDTGNQWCERKDYVCPYACERAVREKAERVITDASGLLAGLPHYAQHKWGMADAAWRKRAEEAEADLARVTAERDALRLCRTVNHSNLTKEKGR